MHSNEEQPTQAPPSEEKEASTETAHVRQKDALLKHAATLLRASRYALRKMSLNPEVDHAGYFDSVCKLLAVIENHYDAPSAGAGVSSDASGVLGEARSFGSEHGREREQDSWITGRERIQRDLSNGLMLEEASANCATELFIDGLIMATDMQTVARRIKTYMKTACQAWRRPPRNANLEDSGITEAKADDVKVTRQNDLSLLPSEIGEALGSLSELQVELLRAHGLSEQATALTKARLHLLTAYTIATRKPSLKATGVPAESEETEKDL